MSWFKTSRQREQERQQKRDRLRARVQRILDKWQPILGVTVRQGKTLALRPCIPAEWPGYAVWYRLPDGRTKYEITVRRVAGSTTARAAGLTVRVEDDAVLVELRQDGGSHRIEVDLGDDAGPRYRPRLGTV